MAFHIPFSISSGTFFRIRHTMVTSSGQYSIPFHRPLHVLACSSNTNINQNPAIRRSANYQPAIWEYNYVQSLKSPYKGEVYNGLARELKEGVRTMLDRVDDPLLQLELIDTLQRLGLAYLFDDQIKLLMEKLYNCIGTWMQNDSSLSLIALGFRLLRQYGYDVPSGIFSRFKNKNGNFKTSLCDDIKGLLHLYEASYLLVEGEDVLDEARLFATKHLLGYTKQYRDKNSYLYLLANHALDLPLHWSITRSEARWFIYAYERKEDMNHLLLKLAKLDFNLVQAIHQDDLQDSSKWWRSTGLGEKLSFGRDRLMECFLWALGAICEPQFGYCRISLTKIISLITIIDDVYDVYGTVDELELFTNAIERWDINEVEKLPDYMKICFLVLFNTVNELAFEVLKEQGVCNISYLRNSVTNLFKCHLLEAKWYHNNYMPKLEEYLDNGWKSVSMPCVLVHAYFWTAGETTRENLQYLAEDLDIMRWSGMIVRLTDDLGTSPDEIKRGDVPKSIQCYMHESGATEEDAREHIRQLIDKAWKKLNEACSPTKNSPF